MVAKVKIQKLLFKESQSPTKKYLTMLFCGAVRSSRSVILKGLLTAKSDTNLAVDLLTEDFAAVHVDTDMMAMEGDNIAYHCGHTCGCSGQFIHYCVPPTTTIGKTSPFT